MTNSANTGARTWLEENSLYLSAAITWLRLHLEWCAAGKNDSEMKKKPAVKPEPVRREATSRTATAADSLEERAALARLAMDRLGDGMKSAPALVFLAHALGLSKFESEILLLCAAIEFDPSIQELFAQILGKTASGPVGEMPTFALALTVFDDPAWDALSPDG